IKSEGQSGAGSELRQRAQIRKLLISPHRDDPANRRRFAWAIARNPVFAAKPHLPILAFGNREHLLISRQTVAGVQSLPANTGVMGGPCQGPTPNGSITAGVKGLDLRFGQTVSRIHMHKPLAGVPPKPGVRTYPHGPVSGGRKSNGRNLREAVAG